MTRMRTCRLTGTGTALLLSFLSVLVPSCLNSPDSDGSPCANSRASVNGSADHTLRILCPNGGETYRIGDTITIYADCDASMGFVDAEFLYSVDGGTNWERIPNNGIYWSDAGSLKLPITDGMYPRFIIPDSVASGLRQNAQTGLFETVVFSSVSTSWKLKVWDYVMHDDIADQTDMSFAVTK